MIDEKALVFEKLTVADGYEDDERGKALKEQVHEIKVLMRDAIDTFKRNSIKVGRMLLDLESSKLYLYAYVYPGSKWCTYSSSYISEPFFEFCKRQFGISKSTVYALQDVAKKFGDKDGNVLPAYSGYSYSQLVELLPVSEEDIEHNFSSSMTVKEMQKKKNKLKKEKEPSEICAEEVVAEDSLVYVFDDIDGAKEQFKKYCKYLFENVQGSFSTYENNTYRQYKGSGFGELLFEFLKSHHFFDKKV